MIYVYVCPQNHREERLYAANEQPKEIYCSCGLLMCKDWKGMVPAYHDVPFDSVDFDLTGKPIPYSTRGQLKKIARQHGCRVDFGQKSREAKR